MKFLVVNGPNLNMLGIREVGIYGTFSYDDLCEFIKKSAKELDVDVDIFQSNHEGEIVTTIQNSRLNYNAIVINPAALTHTSVAVLDALKAVNLPCAEVHLTDINSREPFRKISYAGMACAFHVMGEGKDGYKTAMVKLKAHLEGKDIVKAENEEIFINPYTVIAAGFATGANEKIVIIGGPCSIEGEAEAISIANTVKSCGATMLRGGAYKPRTSPHAFQGIGQQGVLALAKAKSVTGLPVVSEIVSEAQIEEFEKYVDVVQIGARNMQNYSLLKAVAKINKPVLLKRGFGATLDELLQSAEYITSGGNPNVILCERGIRTFETSTRATLDLSAIPILREKTHLPIYVDPSHAAGDYRYVESMSLAAVAAGADGLLIEVHEQPELALSDGAQSLKPEKFAALVKKVKAVANAIGREVYGDENHAL